MASTDEQQRVPLREAFKIWTGREAPPPMTPEQRRDFEAKLREVDEQARVIYGTAAERR